MALILPYNSAQCPPRQIFDASKGDGGGRRLRQRQHGVRRGSGDWRWCRHKRRQEPRCGCRTSAGGGGGTKLPHVLQKSFGEVQGILEHNRVLI
ncbi:hypothetical protein ZEAMMB73_Zm00001d051435 [Zea mays]|uniref:Uncharacterized protein n=1 Tax=Zea mays TaxID=4577 RepID=A0A1D6Q6W8_MAIZE|nr:hypothetical protein ZEAMMB73_Zm00001d051435 [Zea mays]